MKGSPEQMQWRSDPTANSLRTMAKGRGEGGAGLHEGSKLKSACNSETMNVMLMLSLFPTQSFGQQGMPV